MSVVGWCLVRGPSGLCCADTGPRGHWSGMSVRVLGVEARAIELSTRLEGLAERYHAMAALIQAGQERSQALRILAEEPAPRRVRQLLRRAAEAGPGGPDEDPAWAALVDPATRAALDAARDDAQRIACLRAGARTLMHWAQGQRALAMRLEYPMLMVVVAMLVVGHIGYGVLPEFVAFHSEWGQPLPQPTRLLASVLTPGVGVAMQAAALLLGLAWIGLARRPDLRGRVSGWLLARRSPYEVVAGLTISSAMALATESGLDEATAARRAAELLVFLGDRPAAARMRRYAQEVEAGAKAPHTSLAPLALRSPVAHGVLAGSGPRPAAWNGVVGVYRARFEQLLARPRRGHLVLYAVAAVVIVVVVLSIYWPIFAYLF